MTLASGVVRARADWDNKRREQMDSVLGACVQWT